VIAGTIIGGILMFTLFTLFLLRIKEAACFGGVRHPDVRAEDDAKRRRRARYVSNLNLYYFEYLTLFTLFLLYMIEYIVTAANIN